MVSVAPNPYRIGLINITMSIIAGAAASRLEYKAAEAARLACFR